MGYQEGIVLFKSGDYGAALDHFYLIIKEDKNNHKAWNALGICLFKLERFDKANIAFSNALKIFPNNENYRKNKEVNELKKLEKEKSLLNHQSEYKENNLNIQSKNHNNTPALTKNAEISYNQNWYLVPLFFIIIIGWFIVINLQFFWYIPLLMWIGGSAYIKKDAENIYAGKNPNASFIGKIRGWEWSLLIAAFHIFTFPIYFYKRKDIYSENFPYKDSTDSYSYSIVKIGVIIICLIQIIIYMSAGLGVDNSTSSVSTSTLSSSSGDEMIWVNKGDKLLYEIHNYEDALSAYNKALEINPKSSKAWYGKSQCLFSRGEIQSAIIASKNGLDSNPTDTHIKSGLWFNLAVLYSNDQRYEESIFAFDEALKIKQSDLIFGSKAWTLLKIGNREDALKNAYKALEINPNSETALLVVYAIENNLDYYDLMN